MTITPNVLLMIIAVIAVILVMLIIYISYKRYEQKKLFAVRDAYMVQHQSFWYRYLVNDEPFERDAIPKKKGHFLAVEQILLSYIDNVSNETIHAKVTDFAKRYMFNYYKHLLNERKWSRRMNALFRIEDFELDTLLPQCIDMYKKSSTSREERYTLMAIFAHFSPQTFYDELFKHARAAQFSEFEYRRIYVAMTKQQLLEIVERLEELPTPAARYALIDTLGALQDFDYVHELEQLLTDGDSEVRIRALKSLYQLNWINNLSLYTPFVTSAIWEERLMLAKVLQHVPLEHSERLLLTLIEDANWWVRKQAAETIIHHRQGADVLRRTIATTEDRFAKEVAQEVLTKAGVAV